MTRSLLLFFGLTAVSIAHGNIGEWRKALEKPVSTTILRALTISLEELGEEELGRWVSGIEPPRRLVGRSLDQFEKSLRAYVLRRMELDGLISKKAEMESAFQDTDHYLGLDERLLINTGFEVGENGSGVEGIELDPGLEDEISDLDSLEWNGVDHYVQSRLGPLTGLLSLLGREDQLILTNLGWKEFGRFLPSDSRLVRFDLPLASYGKSIWMSRDGTGKKTLVLGDFDSRSYLVHFGLMSLRFARQRGMGYGILKALDRDKLESSTRQLVNFARKNPICFEDLDALIIGYGSGFLKRWKKWIHSQAAEGGKESWKITRFVLPEGVEVALLGGDVDFHGERLAAQLEALMGEFPVKNIFFGGSGGSLVPAKPYNLKIPGRLMDAARNCLSENILDGSGREVFHISVDSPLEESPVWLHGKRSQGIETVDMELGRLACLSSKYGVNIGAAILVTDYPMAYGSIQHQLGQQKFGAKKPAKERFVNLVESYLRFGKKVFDHPIEDHAGESIEEISRKNLSRLRRSLQPADQGEVNLVSGWKENKSRVFVRMSEGRLYHGLKNRALYSTGLVKSLGFAVNPFTPELEHRVFGAWDYIFAEYSTGVGWKRYGDVVVFLKEARVLPRSFATRASGYRLTRGQEKRTLEERKNSLKEQVFHPHHYGEAVYLMSLRRLRNLDYFSKQEDLENPSQKWLEARDEIKLRYMELKIRDYVLVEDIHSVWIPQGVDEEIIRMLESYGIFYRFYDPSDHPN